MINIWCPKCGGTQFYNDKIGEANEPGMDIIVNDQMKCKNRLCGYDFQIQWFAYVREEWLRVNTDQRIQRFQKRRTNEAR